jgi:hypothetical protein
MKDLYQLLFATIFTFSAYGQGLNGELGFNDDYRQEIQAEVICVDEFSFFAKKQYLQSFYTPSILYKIDTLENVVWEIGLSPQIEYEGQSSTAEVTEVTQLIASENGGVYVMGYAIGCCDCAMGTIWFVQKINETGEKDWIKKWYINEFAPVNEYMSGLSYDDNTVFVNFYKNTLPYPNPPQYESVIYSLNSTDGMVTDSLENLSTYELNQISNNSYYERIASKQNQLMAFDISGALVNSISYNSDINGFLTVNDTIFVLTSDSIFSYSSDFTLLNTNPLNGYHHHYNLKSISGTLHFFTHTGQNSVIINLNHELAEIDFFFVPEEASNIYNKDFSSSHLSAVTQSSLSEYAAIRHLDYSLSSEENKEINRTDIGIVDLDFYDATIEYVPQGGFHWLSISAKALVKNFGDKIATECRINHRTGFSPICGEYYYSIWIDLDIIHSETTSVSAETDTIIKNICVYSSHPNGIVDLNVSNDRLCKNSIIGYVGLDNLKMEAENEKKIVKIVDILGKETEEKPNTLLIYIYDDGTTKKVVQIK